MIRVVEIFIVIALTMLLLFGLRPFRQDKKSVRLKFNNFHSEYPLQSCVLAYPVRFPFLFR